MMRPPATHPADNPALLPDHPFTTTQALQLGLSRRRLDELVATSEIRRVLTGVYVRADIEDTVAVRCAAARLVLAPFVVICDRTAAWLWGVDTFEYRELEILPPLEVFALRGFTRPRREGCKGGTRDLAPEDVVDLEGVLVTPPLRTALDLACKLSRRSALAALDGFMRSHGLTTVELKRGLRRYFRRRGVVQARELVPLADGGAESPGESWTRIVILDHGLPKPELQWWVTVDGVPTFRLDMAYPKHKVAIEYDGREFHEGEDHRLHDAARRRWLTDHGWTVVVVTKEDFSVEAVSGWIGLVRRGLGQAA